MAVGFQTIELDWKNYGLALLEILIDIAKRAKLPREAVIEAWETLGKMIATFKEEPNSGEIYLGDEKRHPKAFVGVIVTKKKIKLFFTTGEIKHLERAEREFSKKAEFEHAPLRYFGLPHSDLT